MSHFHIMDSSYGDVLGRHVKTWAEAVRQLQKESRCYNGTREGVGTQGMYLIDDEEIMLSIYECLGSCQLEEEEEEEEKEEEGEGKSIAALHEELAECERWGLDQRWREVKALLEREQRRLVAEKMSNGKR